MKYKIFLILLICILVLIGCCWWKKENSEESLMLEYLNDTYFIENDKFVLVGCGFDSFPGWNDRCYFKSEKYNGDVTVRMSKKNRKYVFKDDYFKLYMFKDAKSYFEEIASDLSYYEVKIRFGPDYLNKYKTFKDYNCDASLDIFYITNYDIGEEQQQVILNIISSNIRSGTVYFFVTRDSHLLKNVDLDSVLSNQNQYIDSEIKYYINNNKIEKLTV